MIPEWPASFGPPEYDEMRPLILDHADKMLNQSRRIKLLDANKVIDELNVLAQDLPDGDSGVLNRAVEVIEHLLENQAGAPQDDGHLKMMVTHLVATLRDVSLTLAAKAQVSPATVPEQVERRCKPRNVYPPMNPPPYPGQQAGWGEPPH